MKIFKQNKGDIFGDYVFFYYCIYPGEQSFQQNGLFFRSKYSKKYRLITSTILYKEEIIVKSILFK